MYGVIGRSTDISAGCQAGSLRFDDLETTHTVLGRKYKGKNTNGIFIGDYTRTGIGNLFFPGVKIGCNTALGPGLIISKDIAENKLVMVDQQTNETDWNNSRYGW
jgi:bifunctional UDP-N-acetylglucosamine pyrophosphorylase/glucosamine-1-phosphate N-acetyltransferase